MTLARSALLTLPLLFVLHACDGETLDGGSTGVQAVSVDVPAVCAAPSGPAEVPETAAAFTNALLGRWLVCGLVKDAPHLLQAHNGLDFRADGTWSFLKPGAVDGTYEDTAVAGTNGTWTLHASSVAGVASRTDTTPSKTVTLRLVELGLDLEVAFQVAPRRFTTAEDGQPLTFVWSIPETGTPAPYQPTEGEACADATPCAAGLTCARFDAPDGQIAMCARGR
jgi:hypothetical protein